MKLRLAVLFVLLMVIPSVLAQESGVQEITGSVSPDEPYFAVVLPEMTAGQTVYIYVESEEIDTWVVICYNICEEYLAENDDMAEGNSNSALEAELPTDGYYSIVVGDCCDEGAEGDFRLLISLDNADVLTGEAEPTGAEIASIPDETTDSEASEYRDVCLPESDDPSYPPDVQALFDVLDMTDEFEQDLLTDIGFASIQEMQDASDQGDINWYFFIPFLQDVTMVTLHVCNGSTPYVP